jgi:hypothetical protein
MSSWHFQQGPCQSPGTPCPPASGATTAVMVSLVPTSVFLPYTRRDGDRQRHVQAFVRTAEDRVLKAARRAAPGGVQNAPKL